MNYPPNEEGAVWMARRVWPLVRSERPDARLQLVGAQPTATVRALADPSAHIEVTGSVPDVRPYLWHAGVAAAPLLTARGIQNKVLEAVAAGLPAVITPIVEAGLPPAVLPACVTAAGPNAFAHEIVTLLNLTPVERRQRAASANLTLLSWEQQLEPLRSILEDAANTSHLHRARSAS
jgi:glycosyltransferase involved in cell wall biosynthesis